MSVLLQRSDGLRTLYIEALVGIDGQGMPQYAASVQTEGRVVWEDEVIRGITGLGATGEEIATVAKAWVGADQAALPKAGDRIRTEDVVVGIVVTRKAVHELRYGDLVHVRVGLRKE